MTVRRLTPGQFWLLGSFVSSEPRSLWVAEAEDFLVNVAPSGLGDARGSSIVVVDTGGLANVAAAVYRPHGTLRATHLQCFVLRADLRGHKLAEPALAEVRDHLLDLEDSPGHLVWAVRSANDLMLRVSDRVVDRLHGDDELVHFVHP